MTEGCRWKARWKKQFLEVLVVAERPFVYARSNVQIITLLERQTEHFCSNCGTRQSNQGSLCTYSAGSQNGQTNWRTCMSLITKLMLRCTPSMTRDCFRASKSVTRRQREQQKIVRIILGALAWYGVKQTRSAKGAHGRIRM